MSTQTISEASDASEGEALPARPQHFTTARLNIAVCILLLVLAAVFMSGGLMPGRVAAPMQQLLAFPPWQSIYPQDQPSIRGGDAILQQLPWHQWIRDELGAGRFPLWVSGPLGGYNLFASYQPAVLYPLSLLWALLPTGYGYGIIMALKLWLAGVGMWFFLRSLRLRAFASLLGALGFMFSAGMVTWLPWPQTNVYLLLPWLSWAIYGWGVGKNRWALAGLSLLTAFATFGGHPELFFMTGLSVGVWAVALLLGSDRRQWLRQAVGWGVSAAIGLLIGAIQLLPFIEAFGLSHANVIRQGGTGTAPFNLDAGSILDWILPRTWGQVADGVMTGKISFTEANAYVGLVTLFGVLLVIVAAVRRLLPLRLILPWAVLALFGWLTAYDVSLGYLIRRLPLFNQSVNGRWILVVAFSFLVLSAFGWDWLAGVVERRVTSNDRPARWLAGWCMLGVGILVLAAHFLGLIARPSTGQPPGVLVPPYDDYRLYWAVWEAGIALTLLGAILLWISQRRAARFMPVLLCGLLVADLWTLLITYNQTAPAAYFYPQANFIDQLSVVPPTERILVDGEGPPTNTGLIFGFRDWEAQDPMTPQRAYKAATFMDPNVGKSVWTFYNLFLNNPRLPVAVSLGISYFIVPRGINPNEAEKAVPDRPNFTRLAYTNGLGLWRAEDMPGYAYLSNNVWAEGSEADAAQWTSGVTWTQMRNYAAMVEAPDSTIAGMEHTSYTPGSGEPGSVKVAQYAPGHIVLDVDATRQSLLVVAESYYPGWQATIDGQPAPILRANYLSQGLITPQGRHTVEFSYQPDSFKYGVLLSLAGLASLLALAGWALLAGRKAPPHQ